MRYTLIALASLALLPSSAQAFIIDDIIGGLTGRGAPAPIAGAGLPLIALAGVYWLARRRRAKKRERDKA
jgi:hypothetical protein